MPGGANGSRAAEPARHGPDEWIEWDKFSLRILEGGTRSNNLNSHYRADGRETHALSYALTTGCLRVDMDGSSDGEEMEDRGGQWRRRRIWPSRCGLAARMVQRRADSYRRMTGTMLV